ncbi:MULTISPECIES: hypothetical protein [Stenotrophomonas]|uniref:hypothetical protein n=1 Tax=Stenotrophomonas TaxID=40323 RepID=UPI0015DF53BA|nr:MULTISPECIES: hypothetical protein [Stenotrophomonas]MBA0432011.1 hypothetical protein [Stenotrophomonas maltophilia]MDH0273316.1 hypothetical protein [Stenotrophomonas sp. GD04089]MDH1912657.1 hypothetical protein [Stenotrophomonas sp. GD03794]HEL3810570.1 hypothetical protein [Stenotrophomonas maltophilia]
MDERLHKRWMAIAGLLVGLPTVAAGGTGAVLGLMVVWDGKYLTGDEHRILLLWSSAGIIGLLSWLWLSGLFLWRGVTGLRQSPVVAWIGLALGGLAALGVVAATLYFTFKRGEISTLAFLGFGPPLLVMAGHLAWLRWARAASAPPAPG